MAHLGNHERVVKRQVQVLVQGDRDWRTTEPRPDMGEGGLHVVSMAKVFQPQSGPLSWTE